MDTSRGRRRLLALAIGSLLAASRPTARAATAAVDEVGTSFQPAQLEVAVGDTVVWTNRSNTAHSVAFQSGPDLRPTCAPGLLGPVGNCQDPGETAQYTFTAARNYAYWCKLHTNMKGVVVVSPAGTSSTATTSPTTPTTRPATTTTRATSSTTATTRALATSSTVVKSSTTTSDTSSVLLPNDAPPFTGEDANSAAGQAGGSGDDGGDTTTVALIVGLLLAVAAGGGYLLWRLRPSRA